MDQVIDSFISGAFAHGDYKRMLRYRFIDAVSHHVQMTTDDKAKALTLCKHSDDLTNKGDGHERHSIGL